MSEKEANKNEELHEENNVEQGAALTHQCWQDPVAKLEDEVKDLMDQNLRHVEFENFRRRTATAFGAYGKCQ